MILKGDQIASELQRRDDPHLRIIPTPDLASLAKAGTASVDLRLGRWLVRMRQTRTALLNIESGPKEPDGTRGQEKEHFVPFGGPFILHPGKFVLGITLEWIALPPNLAAYVTGKSSWARRGLIIETAAGIHPGFSGCITLEMTNIGEVPIPVTPGMEICQLFFHRADGDPSTASSRFDCQRKPIVNVIKEDWVLQALKNQV